LRKVDTLIVDKTGTLTEGKPAFDRAVAANGFTADEVLRSPPAWTRAASIRWPTPSCRPRASGTGAGEGARASNRVQRHRRARNGRGLSVALGNTALMQQLGVAVDALAAGRGPAAAKARA
jgi:P-type Cu+ transporter